MWAKIEIAELENNEVCENNKKVSADGWKTQKSLLGSAHPYVPITANFEDFHSSVYISCSQ